MDTERKEVIWLLTMIMGIIKTKATTIRRARSQAHILATQLMYLHTGQPIQIIALR